MVIRPYAVLFDELLQARIVERAGLELSRRLLGG
jgi:hypothetical protein